MIAAVFTVPSTAFDQVLELPAAISPTMAGVMVGIVTAVIVFTVFALVITRRTRSHVETLRASANDVVFIPPPVAPQNVAPQNVVSASEWTSERRMPAMPAIVGPVSVPGASPQRFVPSSALSARAFAKMGFAFGERVDEDPLDPFEQAFEARYQAALTTAATPPMPPVAVPPAPRTEPMISVVETGPASQVSFETKNESSSVVSVGARIDDLSFDDNAQTEFCEPFFDEPPQPPKRGSRPKIRKVAPAAPRFPTPRG